MTAAGMRSFGPKALAAGALALALAARAIDASAQCSGGASCPPCTMCRVPPASGTNLTVAEMATLFDRIAAGPAVYGSLGWDFGSNRTIGAGPGWCGRAGARDTVPAHFPCILLKAIYLTESAWRQFCSTNQTVISFDCGYGIAQVTSGMRRGETSAFDPNRVAAEPAYNVSVGAAILAGKWRISPCVGDNDPDVIEDWYFAVWGYNGFSYRNNPNNPMYAADRPEFRTPGIASAQVRGNYPYQELVWGYAHYPLSSAHYTGLGLAYPNRSEICASCGLPSANISEPPGAHRSSCPGSSTMPDAGMPDAARADAARADVVMPTDVMSSPDAAGAIDAQGEDVVRAPDARASEAGRDGGPSGLATGGCGCNAPGARRVPGTLVLAAVLGALLTVRRRRRS